MSQKQANGVSMKPPENGVRGKPPLYSVETPYGFHLDLDFLKYVDDIEKGHTLKRVPIQRRAKGPKSSTLPRSLNLPGHGYRAGLWGSTSALGAQSKLAEGHSGYPRGAGVPSRLLTQEEMEARAFDEQLLGEHVRPHLLRAASLPVTVLHRRSSEAIEEPGTPSGSRDRLSSAEDVFHTPDGSSDATLRQLREALTRVAQLEAKVIPELKAQIRTLQEERERLRLRIDPELCSPNGPQSYGTSPDLWASRPSSVSGWRASEDLDELLTVTALQAKVAVLEQRLHESHLERKRAGPREQGEAGRNKVTTQDVWVRVERAEVEGSSESGPSARGAQRSLLSTSNGLEGLHGGSGPRILRGGAREEGQCVIAAVSHTEKISVVEIHRDPGGSVDPQRSDGGPGRGDKTGQMCEELLCQDGTGPAAMAHQMARIQDLLRQQWDCLCGRGSARGDGALQHPDPRINSIQEQLMSLVHALLSFYASPGQPKGGGTQSMGKKTGGGVTTPEKTGGGADHWEGKGAMSEGWTGGHAGAAKAGGEESNEGQREEETDPGRCSSEAPDSTEEKPQSREAVDEGFLRACRFVNDHMEQMDHPSKEMRESLVALFQEWFRVAAEEDSRARDVALYLGEVGAATPPMLRFLVNMADDNGNTALHYSVSHSNLGIVKVLLDTGVCEVDRQNTAGYTAVMLASLCSVTCPEDMAVAQRLMELGDVNAVTRQAGQTALHLAARHGRSVMVSVLLSRRANPNAQDQEGITPLMCACERGHLAVACLLLETTACDTNVTDSRGRTALSVATGASHGDIADLLSAYQATSHRTTLI